MVPKEKIQSSHCEAIQFQRYFTFFFLRFLLNFLGEQSHAEWLKDNIKGPNYGKNADFISYGVPRKSKQGARQDLEAFYVHVKAGLSDIELADIDFAVFCRCMKAIDRIRISIRPELTQRREVVLLCGVTGAGKTRAVYDQYPDLYEAPIGDTLWFDGYDGQKVVLFDEFEGEMPLNALKKVADNFYVRKVPCKGGFKWLNPDKIVFTSNSHPGSWYKGFSKSTKTYHSDRSESEKAIRRRFDAIVHFTELGLVTYVGEEEIKSFWPIGDENPILIPMPVRQYPQVHQDVYDLNPTRSDLNRLEVQDAILDDPFIIEENFCLECHMEDCICAILYDDEFIDEYSQDLFDV